MTRVVLLVTALAFTVYCAIDVLQSDGDRVRRLPKAMWVLVTLLFPAVGGLAWLLVGRPQGGAVGPGRRPQAPRGPDDDPDFLRGL